jgi:PhnB protein
MADLIPYLAARDASAAIAFYVEAFGATEVSRWTEPATGTIGHARVERPVSDAHGDRGGWLFDPAGHRWSITTSGQELSRDELQEQVGASYEIS